MVISDTLKEAICRKIKILRKQHGYSQDDVALLLNMGQNTYSQLESGKTKIDIERLQQIAGFYKINIQEFFLPPPPRSHCEEVNKFYSAAIFSIIYQAGLPGRNS